MPGYNVPDAEAPDEALSLMQSTPGPIHLVLTDMVMPRMSGQELASRITTLKPEARVVFMSGYSEQVVSGQGTLTQARSSCRRRSIWTRSCGRPGEHSMTDCPTKGPSGS